MSVRIGVELSHSQNYLRNPSVVASLLSRSSIDPDDLVIEIGPGKGIITEQLACRCRQLIAIEKDRRLATALIGRFSDRPNIRIIRGDFLEFNLPRKPYKVFANMPFNLGSAILAKLTAAVQPAEDTFLAIQKEAAQIYLGDPHESLRALLVKPWFDVRIFHHFHRRDFFPQPQVDCLMLRLLKRSPALIKPEDKKIYRDLVCYVFSSWQPTISHTLKELFSWRQFKRVKNIVDIHPDATPTTLTFEQWLSLFGMFLQVGDARAGAIISGSENRLLKQQQRLVKLHRTRIAR